MTYVPCPADYYRLGYVSWVMMEDEGVARVGVSDLFLKAAQGIQTFELAKPDDVLELTDWGRIAELWPRAARHVGAKRDFWVWWLQRVGYEVDAQ